MAKYRPRPLTGHVARDGAVMRRRAANFYREVSRRRTVRAFSARSVPRAVIEKCVLSAGSAPSGANMQPWHFTVVSAPAVKRRIRLAAEKEEREFYDGRAPKAWLKALQPLGTDANKPYLETAPYLIVVFQRGYDIDAAGQRIKQYYVTESVGIATGILLTALNHAGLATLTHTPSPMGFLRTLLGRPANERAAMIVVAGYPARHAKVPDIERKKLTDIASFIE
ncbi:MAG: nitroreductase family protein [Alphaproteobacteria bacterium]|jgi:nitroreductase|nr:nitroreductase family protein [Alphaproteobacteria bacterium]MDP6587952.1 nitroreductase family protein [Alphaproteobacteria bacterium]MDP6818239.1 nitroreductase family protein [Alphaproteobacteria bacterium]